MANLQNIDDNLKNQNDAYAKSHKEQITAFKQIQKLKKEILEVEKLETEESKKTHSYFFFSPTLWESFRRLRGGSLN